MAYISAHISSTVVLLLLTGQTILGFLLPSSSSSSSGRVKTFFTSPLSLNAVGIFYRQQQYISKKQSALFMGRAAAVRAATKAKTDAKKAKTNALFGKKIIVAVKVCDYFILFSFC